MPYPPIHWTEGMFLGPQHLQSAERSLRELVATAEEWAVGHPYGVRHVEIDRDALSNRRVVISRCHVRLRDGTHVRYPEDASLPPAAIPADAFRSPVDRVTVHLALPRLEMGRPNAAAAGADAAVRYLVEPVKTDDENESQREQVVDFRRLNARLIVGNTGLGGFETLPLFRLKLGAAAEAPPEIDPDYIPPILACDAWPPLRDQFLGGIRDRLGGASETLARQMIDRGVAFESGHREDFERILKLHAVNAALGEVWNLPVARGLHPFEAYSALCRAAGMLALFRDLRRLPELPKYDHDDLAGTFFPLRPLLDIVQRAPYVKTPFIGDDAHRLRVILDPAWLGAGWSFYIGVESELSDEQIDDLLIKQLDMKVASSDQVRAIFDGGHDGIRIYMEKQPPRDFPRGSGGRKWSYWRVDRRSPRWQRVEETPRHDLGLRFNDSQVEGSFKGITPVRLRRPDGRTLELVFALYALPHTAGASGGDGGHA